MSRLHDRAVAAVVVEARHVDAVDVDARVLRRRAPDDERARAHRRARDAGEILDDLEHVALRAGHLRSPARPATSVDDDLLLEARRGDDDLRRPLPRPPPSPACVDLVGRVELLAGLEGLGRRHGREALAGERDGVRPRRDVGERELALLVGHRVAPVSSATLTLGRRLLRAALADDPVEVGGRLLDERRGPGELVAVGDPHRDRLAVTVAGSKTNCFAAATAAASNAGPADSTTSTAATSPVSVIAIWSVTVAPFSAASSLTAGTPPRRTSRASAARSRASPAPARRPALRCASGDALGEHQRAREDDDSCARDAASHCSRANRIPTVSLVTAALPHRVAGSNVICFAARAPPRRARSRARCRTCTAITLPCRRPSSRRGRPPRSAPCAPRRCSWASRPRRGASAFTTGSAQASALRGGERHGPCVVRLSRRRDSATGRAADVGTAIPPAPLPIVSPRSAKASGAPFGVGGRGLGRRGRRRRLRLGDGDRGRGGLGLHRGRRGRGRRGWRLVLLRRRLVRLRERDGDRRCSSRSSGRAPPRRRAHVERDADAVDGEAQGAAGPSSHSAR